MATFDGRLFDGGTFNVETSTSTTPVTQTAGGWVPRIQPTSLWAPSDVASGTQWNVRPKGQSTW